MISKGKGTLEKWVKDSFPENKKYTEKAIVEVLNCPVWLNAFLLGKKKKALQFVIPIVTFLVVEKEI